MVVLAVVAAVMGRDKRELSVEGQAKGFPKPTSEIKNTRSWCGVVVVVEVGNRYHANLLLSGAQANRSAPGAEMMGRQKGGSTERNVSPFRKMTRLVVPPTATKRLFGATLTYSGCHRNGNRFV